MPQPYIAKHLFSAPTPPVNLRKIAIGDGSLGSFATIRHLPVVCGPYTTSITQRLTALLQDQHPGNLSRHHRLR